MTLDEQTRAFLEAVATKPAPPPEDTPLADFRAAVEAFRALGFDEEDVARTQDLNIAVEATGGDVKVRLYVPETSSPPPIIVWAHGGSWVRVTVDLLENHFRVYANRSRCAIAAVDYGLSPESQFPAAIEEIYAAGKWLKQNGDELELDSTRLGIAGESSGGNLAAAVALLDRDRRSVRFSHQALIVPVLDATFASRSWQDLGNGYVLTRAQLEWALTQYAPGVSPTEPLLSPVHAPDLSGLPATLIVTGEYDPLRDEGERYAGRLREAGVPVAYTMYLGLIHHALMVPRTIERGRRMLEETTAAIGAAVHSSAADEVAEIVRPAGA
jgi:acetyl esterase/lipase